MVILQWYKNRVIMDEYEVFHEAFEEKGLCLRVGASEQA